MFTTTTSAAAARSRACSAKQIVPDGQRKAPGHSRADTDSAAQARGWGSKSSSARSPVADVVGPGDEPAELAAQAPEVDGLGARRGAGARLGGAPPPSSSRRTGATLDQAGLARRAAHLGGPLAAEVVRPALQHGERDSAGRRPSRSATRGRSLVASWSCRALVAVATTTRRPESTAGTR